MDAVMSRRDLLKGLGAATLGLGAGALGLPGCGYDAPERGAAFAPWDFPGDETAPARVVARAGLLAASPHNTQPWGLRIGVDAIELRARADQNLGTMDSLRRELHVGLGCALENMVVAARAVGLRPVVDLLPEPADEALVARIGLSPGASGGDPLFAAIARRHTNRGAYAEVDAPPGLEPALRALADEPSLSFHWLGTRAERVRFRAETIAATEAIAGDAEMSEDSHRWYRHGKDEIERHRDGTTLDASGVGAATRAAGKLVGRPGAGTANRYWLDATRGRHTTGSAYAILASAPEGARADVLRAGRIYQRMHLWATLNGLAMQPLNQLAERQDREETAGLPPRFTGALASMIGSDRRAQMLFRIGYPWDDALESPRRPLEWVLS